MTIAGEQIDVDLGPRVEVMVELLKKHGKEIEHHEHGEVRLAYHLGEVVMDVRVARDRQLVKWIQTKRSTC